MERTQKVTKFITINVPAVDWLAYVVAGCSALAGSSKFYKVRRDGSRVLLAQCCHNKSGLFFIID